MGIKEIFEGKRKWKAHKGRIKELPKDYQIVYKEIEKYLYKIGPVELSENIDLLSGIVDLFEEGSLRGKGVLEITGKDVGRFCDELIKDSTTYSDIYQDLEYKKRTKK